MIIEQALLNVKAGQSERFARAMAQARQFIAVQPGFLSIEVRPSIDMADQYLLLISWEDVESHRDGFRNSPEYKSWSVLLHDFYDPMPSIRYFGPSIIP